MKEREDQGEKKSEKVAKREWTSMVNIKRKRIATPYEKKGEIKGESK